MSEGKTRVDNWAKPLSKENHDLLVAGALFSISEQRVANNPTVVLFACNADALAREVQGLQKLTDKYMDAFTKAEQVQAALEVTVESRDILAAEVAQLQAEQAECPHCGPRGRNGRPVPTKTK
jgi:hypothetical protein